MRAAALATIALFAVAADVMPHCGGPKVDIQGPGEECGAHGSRWRGDCRAPTECFRLERGGTVCTTTCEKDADCTRLGVTFTCGAEATRYDRPNDATPFKVCKGPAR
ncbi:MAG: hypothetical protein KC657_13475 [Myxococcales bacterium]|nr:hypothetical protein [Myxococcales bacterium]